LSGQVRKILTSTANAVQLVSEVGYRLIHATIYDELLNLRQQSNIIRPSYEMESQQMM
jgi:hypothetical protein